MAQLTVPITVFDPEKGRRKFQPSDAVTLIQGEDVAPKSVTADTGNITRLGVEPAHPSGNVSAAGGNQTTATALSPGINVVTVGTAGQGLLLPLGGGPVTVLNNVNAALKLYAPLGNGTINGGAANGNITLGNLTSCMAVPTSEGAKDYITIPRVPS